MSQSRVPFPHGSPVTFTNTQSLSENVSASVNSNTLFAASATNPQESSSMELQLKGLINQILEKISLKTDDELMNLMNEAIDNKQLSLKEAADLFYSLLLVCQMNKELRGAALTLQLKVAQHYASACEWYCDRFHELEKIAKKLSFCSNKADPKIVLDKLLTASEKEIDLITTLTDPLFFGKLSKSWYATNASANSLVGLLVKAQVNREDGPQLTITELGQLPVLLEFFQKNSSAEFKAAAMENYKLVDHYRQRHNRLISLSRTERTIGGAANFQIEVLQKTLALIVAKENKEIAAEENGKSFGMRV